MISIIIAAGKQSRFNSDVPKALSKLPSGETLANHNYNMLKQLGDVYIAVSNQNKEYFEQYFSKDTLIDVGAPGLGSGDAAYKAVCELNYRLKPKEHVVICWGDVYLTDKHIDILKSAPKIHGITIPVREEENPYVCINKFGALFSKYDDVIPHKGLHDLSMFIVNAFSLMTYCSAFREKFYTGETYYIRPDNEFEFLDLLNYTGIETEIYQVDDIEDYSFNTVDEFTKITDLI